jgi:hypothetical protein
MNSHYLKYKNKYKNSKFILNGGMKEEVIKIRKREVRK